MYDPDELLSTRELEILTLVGQGLNAGQAAKKLGLSERTVEVHRANIRNKLHLSKPGELLRFAIRWQHDKAVRHILTPLIQNPEHIIQFICNDSNTVQWYINQFEIKGTQLKLYHDIDDHYLLPSAIAHVIVTPTPLSMQSRDAGIIFWLASSPPSNLAVIHLPTPDEDTFDDFLLTFSSYLKVRK